MIKCRYCRQGGFRWVLVRGGWRLFDRAGVIHVCEPGLQAQPVCTTRWREPSRRQGTPLQLAQESFRASYHDKGWHSGHWRDLADKFKGWFGDQGAPLRTAGVEFEFEFED